MNAAPTPPSRRDIVLDIIARRGLHLETRGQAVKIYGRGIDLLVSDLSVVEKRDLDPLAGIKRG